MIVDEFLDDIKASMHLFLNNANKNIDKANVNGLIRISTQSKEIFGYFLPVLKPNKYMKAVMSHLSIFGGGSVKQITKVQIIKDEEISKTKKESIHTMMRNQCYYLKILKIVTIHIIPYTKLNPTTIYLKRDITIEKLDDLLSDYTIFEKGNTTDRQPDQIIEYKHTKDPTPAPVKKAAKDEYRPTGVPTQICSLCNDVLDEHNNLQCKNPKWRMIEV